MPTRNKDTPEHHFPCPLCRTLSPAYFSDLYYRCPACEGIFRNPTKHLSPDAEKARYDSHNNDPADPRYRNFVSPLVTAITNHVPPGSHGLDFGAGPGPVVSAMLREQDYRTDLYDPFFHPDRSPLERTWDFVFCCEVIEHFYHPADEFSRLSSLLRPGAPLFCMTHIHTDDIDFPTWYYKNDETHTFIYREKTLHTITRLIGFTTCTIDGRVIRFDTPAGAGAGAADPAGATNPATLSPAEALNPGGLSPAEAFLPAEALNPAALSPAGALLPGEALLPAGATNPVTLSPAEALNPGGLSPAGALLPGEALLPAGATNPGAGDPAGALSPAEALLPVGALLPGKVAPIAKAKLPAEALNPGEALLPAGATNPVTLSPAEEGPHVRP